MWEFTSDWGVWQGTSYAGAKKIIFTACHSGKKKQTFTSPDVISTSPKSFWGAELISQFFCYLNSSKKITCPSGKLKTEFTSPIAKSPSPGLSDTTFFAHWYDCVSLKPCLPALLGMVRYVYPSVLNLSQLSSDNTSIKRVGQWIKSSAINHHNKLLPVYLLFYTQKLKVLI